MDRRDFYFKQAVTEAELNGAFDAVEIALWRLITDWGLFGIASGMVGAQMTPTPTMAVSISGPGYAYDAQGERIFIAAPWAPQPNGLDLSLDSNGIPTAVTSPGNERWVAVFVKFQRALSDPRVDGSSNTIFFQSNESYEFVVVQGGENTIGSAVRADPDPAALRLFDVRLVNGQTSVLNSDIDTTRRQDTFVLAQTPVPLRAGNVQSAIAAMLQALNEHITGAVAAHHDTAISTSARTGANITMPGPNVGAALDWVHSQMDGGSVNIPGAAIAKANFSIPAEVLSTQLSALADQVDATESNVTTLISHAWLAPLVSFGAALTGSGPMATGISGNYGPHHVLWNNRSLSASEPSSQSWIADSIATGTVTIWYNDGEDATWTSLVSQTGISNPPTDLAVDTNGAIWFGAQDGGHVYTYACFAGLSAFALQSTTTLTGAEDLQLEPSAGGGSLLYCAAGSSSAGSAFLGYVAAGALVSAQGGLTAASWLLASNGAFAIAIPKAAAANQKAYKSNTQGSAWTAAIIGLASNDIPIDICWSAQRSLWVLAVNLHGANQTTFWTSPDGVAWTNNGTALSSPNVFGAIAAFGPFLFAMDSGEPMRLFASTDGGQTWFVTPARVSGGSGNVPRVSAGAHQLAIFPAVGSGTASTNVRFSDPAGIGNVPVS